MRGVFHSEGLRDSMPAFRWALWIELQIAFRLNRTRRNEVGSSIREADRTAILKSQPGLDVITSNQESITKNVAETKAPGIAA